MLLAKPIERVKLFDALAGQIEEWVLTGEVKPGDRLPAEGALATQFGVSRPVVREALARLRERGLIDTVDGSGNFISHPETSRLADMMGRHLLLTGTGEASIGNLYEARVAIESVAAGLAAERATAGERELLTSELKEMRDNARSDRAAWAAADVRFHLAVAAASHNPFLQTLLSPLVEVVRTGILGVHESVEAVAMGVAGHERILGAIEARNPAEAKAAMQEHLVQSEAHMKKAFVKGRHANTSGGRQKPGQRGVPRR